MQIVNITREYAELQCMPKDHIYGITSEGCVGYLGTGATIDDACFAAKEHLSEKDLTNYWIELVSEEYRKTKLPFTI
jgi:hypothetical protein